MADPGDDETGPSPDPEGFADPWSAVVDSLQTMWKGFFDHLPLLGTGVVVLIATWLIAKATSSVTRRVAGRTRLNGSLRDLLSQLAGVVVWIAGILVAAIVVFPGMTPAKVLAVLGLGSVAIGFAFKDIFENFFAGILILWRFPFDPGDFIQCEGVEGEIVHTSIRMTTVRQVTGELVAVPNALLFKNPVRVLTDRRHRRVTIACGVDYEADVDGARGVITSAVESCSSVDGDHAVQVFARAFGASSVDFEVTWWTGSKPVDVRRSRDEVVAAVKRALDDAGIGIPFPHRTLTFKEALPIAGRQESELAAES